MSGRRRRVAVRFTRAEGFRFVTWAGVVVLPSKDRATWNISVAYDVNDTDGGWRA